MNQHVKIVAALIILAAIAIVGGKYLKPIYDDWRQQSTSDADATRGTIRIGVDSWVGYYPLCSKELRQRLRRQGYLLRCDDDAADYDGRFSNIRDGNLEMAVATVDSYLLAGSSHQYPATIVAVLDESKGGDAVVAWKDTVDSIDALKADAQLRVAYTPASPSEHLLKSIGVHFDIERFRRPGGNWRVTTDGSGAALEELRARRVEAAVLWEPDVSRAVAVDGIEKILGTDDTEGLIVDILLVNRRWQESDPEAIMTLLTEYFRTLKHYRDNPDQLQSEIADHYDLSNEQAESLLEGVVWSTLSDNARRWFGLVREGGGASEALVDALESAAEILVESGDFASSPIPNDNPYRLTNSQFIADLYGQGLGAEDTAVALEDSLTRDFPALAEAQWDQLREVGTLKVRPIVFQSGSSSLTFDGKREIDRAVESLRHYPNFRIVIGGHTGLRGDPEANRKLSQARADSVARYLRVTYGIDNDRVLARGAGSSQPLPRRSGESDRAYNYRLPRVELALVTEEL